MGNRPHIIQMLRQNFSLDDIPLYNSIYIVHSHYCVLC
nr:MAG TPA: hypothetical protein [Caudoviricetes sp.]